jgi:hypothetical protein
MKRWRDEAEALLDRLEPDHPKEFFHALGDLLTKRFPRGPGKPKGTGGVDDSARLDRIAQLLIFREVEDEEAAVLQVAREDPGADEKSTRRRLRNKLPQVRERLAQPDQAEKAEIQRRAFEEYVEQWDL